MSDYESEGQGFESLRARQNRKFSTENFLFFIQRRDSNLRSEREENVPAARFSLGEPASGAPRRRGVRGPYRGNGRNRRSMCRTPYFFVVSEAESLRARQNRKFSTENFLFFIQRRDSNLRSEREENVPAARFSLGEPASGAPRRRGVRGPYRGNGRNRRSMCRTPYFFVVSEAESLRARQNRSETSDSNIQKGRRTGESGTAALFDQETLISEAAERFCGIPQSPPPSAEREWNPCAWW